MNVNSPSLASRTAAPVAKPQPHAAAAVPQALNCDPAGQRKDGLEPCWTQSTVDGFPTREVAAAVATGKEVTLPNGETMMVGAVAHPTHQAFEVAVGESIFYVTMPPDMSPAPALARLATFYSQQPPHLRSVLNTMMVEGGPSPLDRPGEEPVLAMANRGNIVFYNGEQNLSEWVFAHEFGHLVGDKVEDHQDRSAAPEANEIGPDGKTPVGWTKRMAADGADVSPYGATVQSEDFAESFAAYHFALRNGTLGAFQAAYPHRASQLAAIHEGWPQP